jgi:hypothetical protein
MTNEQTIAPLVENPCYECKLTERLPSGDQHFPFCSEACHTAWAEKNPYKKHQRPELAGSLIPGVRLARS